jgi:hypothetical protein
MPSSSVFIQLMLCRIRSKHAKKFFGKKSLNVHTLKLFSKFCFNVLGGFLMFFGFPLLV